MTATNITATTTLLNSSTYTTAKSKFTDALIEIVNTGTATDYPTEDQLIAVFKTIPKGAVDKRTVTGAIALAKWKGTGVLDSAIGYALLATASDDGSNNAEKATSLLIKLSNASTLLAGFNQVLIKDGLTLF